MHGDGRAQAGEGIHGSATDGSPREAFLILGGDEAALDKDLDQQSQRRSIGTGRRDRLGLHFCLEGQVTGVVADPSSCNGPIDDEPESTLQAIAPFTPPLPHASGEPMKTVVMVLCIVLCASFECSVSARPLAERLAADIEMAEYSIVAALALHKSSESKSLCYQSPYACVGADGAELGLALIGGSKSPLASRRLIELSRFRMDGALSEDYKCYVAMQGDSIIKVVPKLDAKRLAGQCRSEFSAFKRRAGGVSLDVVPENICSSVAEIESSLRELVRLAKAEATCDGV